MGLFEDLTLRGLIEQTSDPEIPKLLAAEAISAYCGFDPSADSLHVGSLLPITLLMRLQRAGHSPVALVGGATGMIGDPSGKSQERTLLSPEQLAENLVGVRSQLERFLDFSGPAAARLVNNADWFAGLGFIDFLRDIGKHFSVNAMIAKESVRARLTEREQGISFTEFSYMLIQAYDFLHLFDEGCTFQVGGSDQWGNITAGIDLIRRKRATSAYGFTAPLITGSDGKKFGKTEGGNVWLDARRTTPYQFYQFFLNADDRDVGRYLRFFSFRPIAEIDELLAESAKEPGKRAAQRSLAFEMTSLVHGEAKAQESQTIAAAFFPVSASILPDQIPGAPRTAPGGDVALPSPSPLDVVRAALAAGEAPSVTRPRSVFHVEHDGCLLVDLLVEDHICSSKSDARRQIPQGGIYLNETRVTDINRRVTERDLLDGKYLLLRKGKKTYQIVIADGPPSAAYLAEQKNQRA